MKDSARRKKRQEKKSREKDFAKFLNIVGNRIYWCLASKNITIREFAQSCDVDECKVLEILKRTARLDFDAEQLYRIYQVSMDVPPPSSQMIAFTKKFLQLNGSIQKKLIRSCKKHPSLVTRYLLGRQNGLPPDSPEILALPAKLGKEIGRAHV